MIQIKRNNSVIFTLEDFGEGSKLSYQLMDHHYVVLKFTTEAPIYFEIGDSVDIPDFGYFELTSAYFPKQNDSDGFEYELQMDAYYMSWKNKLCKYRPQHGANETSFKLTTTVGVHMNVILSNLKALGLTYKGHEFTVDYTTYNSKAFDVQKRFLVKYNSISIIDALNTICSEDALNCEWWVDGSIIYLGFCEMRGQTTFEQDVNVLSMSFSESKSTYITRLYAFGSDRNIPKGYFTGSDADVTTDGIATDYLMLPNKEVDSDGFYAKDGYIENVNVVKNEKQAIEGVVMFEDEYPKVSCTVSEVKTYDSTVDNEDGTKTTQTFWQVTSTDAFTTGFETSWVKSNLTLGIKFTSGALTGMEFDVEFKVIDKKKYYEVIANDTYGRTLPDSVMCPKVGDTFFLFNWDATKITDTDLIPTARLSLFGRAKQYYQKTMISNSNFTCTMDGEKFYNDGTYNYHPMGEQVKLINPMFAQVDSDGKHYRNSRIIGMEIALDIPYDHPQYIVGEKAATSRLGKLEDKVDSITVNGIQIGSTGNGNGGGVYIIGLNDFTPATDSNVYSARRSRKEFLSKTGNDTAQGFIRFMQGLQVGNQFVSGILGEGGVFRKDADGKTYIEADKMYVRIKAYFDSVEIRDYQHTSGNRIASQAKGFTASRVEWLDASGNVTDNINNVVKFRCYWRAKDDEHETQNQFVVGDQAFMEYSDIVDGNLIQKRFWRVVVGRNVSLTEDGEAWIDLSNKANDTITYIDHQGTSRTKSVTGFEPNSSIPQPEDDICQLGNVWDTERQGAIIEYVSGGDAPSYQIFQGIDSFSLDGRNYIGLGYSSLTGNAYINVYGDAYIGDKAGEGGYMSFNQQQRLLEIKGRLNVGSTLSDGRDVNALGVNRGNLLLNTSFTGDYDSEEVNSDTSVDSNTVMYSDPLRHWTANNVTIVPFSQSSSKYAATIATGGSLAQSVTLEKGKWYVLSFRGKGGSIGYAIGGVSGTLQLKETLDTYDVPFVCGDSESGLTITASTEVTLMELRLNEGNLPMSWSQNYNDGNRVMAAVNAYKYISDAIRNASTDIIGGLILSQIIKVGNYRDKVMTEETGGMSGAYLDDNSPFLWGGGDISDAIYTIMKYADNPSYEATEEEIAKMAHFVVTHGGRAILNDVILRGYIYALGGYFRGKITAESGEITGDVVVGDVEGKHIVIKPITEEGAAIVMKNGNRELLDMVFGTEGDKVWFPAVFVKHPVNPVFSRLTFAGLLVSSDDVYTRTANYGVGGMRQHGIFNGKSISTGLSIGLDGKVYLHAYNFTDLRHAWADYDSAAVGDVYVDSNGFLKVKQ